MRMGIGTLALLSATSLTALAAISSAQAQVAQQLSGGAATSAAAAATATPMLRSLGAMPQEALTDAKMTMASPGKMRIIQGNPGTKVAETRGAADDGGAQIGPQNYGANNLNTFYHYSDYLVNQKLREIAPHRYSGWFVFTYPSGGQFRCTASLISKSIAVTAGHCVHQGGGGASGFITSGTYYPAYRDGASTTFGTASANYVVTTGGWANTGALDKGYDVGLVVLNKRSGTTTEIGTKTGWFGFCASNCLQNYWSLSQLGYPGNYYGGTKLTQGEHIERSDSRDFVYGSGMQGGSSGGPHVANIGTLVDSSSSQGQWPYRNIVFGVTSWGYVDQTLKIQGASSLTGPSNSNNFTGMYNLACTRAKALHGAASCSLL